MLVGKIPVAQIGFFRHGLCEAIAWIFLTFWWEIFSEDLMSRTWGRTREVFQGKILSRTCIGVLKHPAGPETVLVKIEFYKKKDVFCLSEATIVVTWKVGNLDVQIWVFFGQMVFSLQ
jgi:hypothetical protein